MKRDFLPAANLEVLIQLALRDPVPHHVAFGVGEDLRADHGVARITRVPVRLESRRLRGRLALTAAENAQVANAERASAGHMHAGDPHMLRHDGRG